MKNNLNKETYLGYIAEYKTCSGYTVKEFISNLYNLMEFLKHEDGRAVKVFYKGKRLSITDLRKKI